VSVALSWTAPTTGTLPFTYHVMQSPHGAGTYAEVATAATTSTTITGLTASTGYDFLIFAGNAPEAAATRTWLRSPQRRLRLSPLLRAP